MPIFDFQTITLEMFRLAQPEFLYLLLLIPALIALYAYFLIARRRREARFGQREVIAPLLSEASPKRVLVKFVLLLLAVALITVALSRPQTGSKLRESKREGVEIMLAVDVSRSMLAEDFTPNRLERTKYAISRLIENLTNDRLGMVVFAGESYVQMPITSDFVSAGSFVRTLSTDMVPHQGTSIASAIDMAVRAFPEADKKTNSNAPTRAIILLTDGESHDDDPLAAAKAATESGVVVHTIGVGTPEGNPIIIDGEMVKDDKGEIVVSKLDEQMLQQIAATTGGVYVRSTSQSVGLDEIFTKIEQMQKQKFDTVRFEEYTEQFYYLIYIVMGLLIVELLIAQKRRGLLRLPTFMKFAAKK